jgi:beta-xylosidase
VSVRDQSPYSINIRNLVSMSELKVSGYNTHDCLTLLSLFLAIAIRAVNHQYLKMVITRMCHFFNAISKKVIDIIELDEIHKEMRVTMCQLEMGFPPSFFDLMEHYMIHLADQILYLVLRTCIICTRMSAI